MKSDAIQAVKNAYMEEEEDFNIVGKVLSCSGFENIKNLFQNSWVSL